MCYCYVYIVHALTIPIDKSEREHRLLRLLQPTCDPTPSCLGDECSFPNCSNECPGTYVLNKEPSEFSRHQGIAQSKGGNLVMIQSLAKMRCIDAMMRLKNNNDISGYWLGGKGTAGRYSWLNGDCVPRRPDDPNLHDWCPNSQVYQRWSASQPDCYPDDQYCPGEGCMCVWFDGNWGDILCQEEKMALYEIDASQPKIPSSYGQPMDVVFAIDNTASMCKDDGAGTTWLQKTNDVVSLFMNRMAAEAPSTSMAGYVWMKFYDSIIIEPLTTDLQYLSANIAKMDCPYSNSDSMHVYEWIRQSLPVFDASKRPDTVASTKAIIYITDGGAGHFVHACADQVKERGIALYIIGYETTPEVGIGLDVMAKCTSGFFRRSDGTSISIANIVQEIFEAINH